MIDEQIAGLKLLKGALENSQEMFQVHGIHIEYNCVPATTTNISEGINVEFTYKNSDGQLFLLKFNLGLYK